MPTTPPGLGAGASLEQLEWPHASLYRLMQQMRGGLGLGLVVRMGPASSGGGRVLRADTPPPPPQGAVRPRPRPTGLWVYRPDARGNQDPHPRNTLLLGFAPCPTFQDLGSWEVKGRGRERGARRLGLCPLGRPPEGTGNWRAKVPRRDGEGTTIPR